MSSELVGSEPDVQFDAVNQLFVEPSQVTQLSWPNPKLPKLVNAVELV